MTLDQASLDSKTKLFPCSSLLAFVAMANMQTNLIGSLTELVEVLQGNGQQQQENQEQPASAEQTL